MWAWSKVIFQIVDKPNNPRHGNSNHVHTASPWLNNTFGNAQRCPSRTSQHEFNSPSQKHPATSPRPSFSIPHAQIPTPPRNYGRYQGKYVQCCLPSLGRIREPVALSFPAQRDPRYDQRPSCTSLAQSEPREHVRNSSIRNRVECLSVRRPNNGSRSVPFRAVR